MMHPMYNFRNGGTLGILMTPVMVNSVIMRSRKRKENRRRIRMTQRRGIGKFAACEKIESAHGAAPSTGGNILNCFGFD